MKKLKYFSKVHYILKLKINKNSIELKFCKNMFLINELYKGERFNEFFFL